MLTEEFNLLNLLSKLRATSLLVDNFQAKF